jgi:hypothetical protein
MLGTVGKYRYRILPALFRGVRFSSSTIITEQNKKHVLTLDLSCSCSLPLSIHHAYSHTHSFVKLDTTSRDEVLQVVMQLRSSTLVGHPVHARLKSTVIAPVDRGVRVWLPTVPWMSPAGAEAVSSLPKKKKTRSRGKRKKKGQTVSSSEGTEVKALENVAELSALSIQVQASLSEDDFPTLLDNHVEWETPLEEHEDVNNKEEEESDSKSSSKNLSDMASTATTTSTSSSSVDKQKATLGYAAALRKAIANPDVVAAPSLSSSKTNAVSKEITVPPTGKRNEESPTHPVASAVLPVVQPAKWGGGRSFVDVLRKS